MTKIVLTISIAANLLLILILLTKPDTKSKVKPKTRNIDYSITSADNFEKVIIEKNDSVYKRIWNQAFENQPEMAFLISVAYFHSTKKELVIEDIEKSKSQLKKMYHRPIE